MNPNGKPVSRSPRPRRRASGMINHMSSVARIELNRQMQMNTMSASTYGSGLGQGGAGVGWNPRVRRPTPANSPAAVRSSRSRAHTIEQLARQAGARVGVNGECRKAIAAHHDRVFPHDFGTGSDLIERNHSPGDGTPDLQAVDGSDIFAFAQWWTAMIGSSRDLLREDSGSQRSPVRDRSRPGRDLQNCFRGPGRLRRA